MKKIVVSTLLVLITLFAFTTNIIKEDSNELAASEASVNQVSLKGQVLDLSSGEALAGVEIKLEGYHQKVYTDFDGNYSFTNLKPGKYNVIASYISYNKSYIEKLNLSSNEDLNIKLQSSN